MQRIIDMRSIYSVRAFHKLMIGLRPRRLYVVAVYFEIQRYPSRVRIFLGNRPHPKKPFEYALAFPTISLSSS